MQDDRDLAKSARPEAGGVRTTTTLQQAGFLSFNDTLLVLILLDASFLDGHGFLQVRILAEN